MRDENLRLQKQVEELKKELETIQQNIVEKKAVEHADVVLSEKTVGSEYSDDERLTYMKHREAKSVDAINKSRIQLEMVDLKLTKQIEME